MNRRLALALIIGFVVLAPAGAHAQTNKLIGTVTAVDADSGTMAVSESHGARAMEFRVDRKSRITVRASRRTLKFADVAVGSGVSVTYAGGDEGEPAIVKHMQVSPPAESGAE
jgi:hypothetical protein